MRGRRGQVTLANRAAHRLFGADAGALTGCHVEQLLPAFRPGAADPPHRRKRARPRPRCRPSGVTGPASRRRSTAACVAERRGPDRGRPGHVRGARALRGADPPGPPRQPHRASQRAPAAGAAARPHPGRRGPADPVQRLPPRPGPLRGGQRAAGATAPGTGCSPRSPSGCARPCGPPTSWPAWEATISPSSRAAAPPRRRAPGSPARCWPPSRSR